MFGFYNNIGICRVTKTYTDKAIIKTQKTKRQYNKKIVEKRFCLYCQSELKASRTKGKFCNSKCQQNYNWTLKKKEIELRGDVGFNLVANSRVAKRYLREIRGIKCEICNITQWAGKEVPLVMDHIDGNPANWKLTNLRLICGNCDMQTDTYKGKNRGHGRFARRLRYRTGKSY